MCLLSYLRSKVSIISYLQAAVEFKDRNNDVLQIESKISQHSTYLKFEDTVISYQMIKKYPREYQGHLERIADFLLESNVWEEIAEGVMFMDVSGTWRKTRHHFRSHTFAEEMKYVESCWNKCFQKPNLIPAASVIDEDGKKIKINNLKNLPTKILSQRPDCLSIR